MPASALSARNPFVAVLASVIAFFVLQFVVFNSGFYRGISNPAGFDNTLSYAIRFEKTRKPSGKKEVLIVGNSKIENAFSLADAKEMWPDAPVTFARGTAPATSLVGWYYTLRALDPAQCRYAAIVVPLSFYRAVPEFEGGGNVKMLAPSFTPSSLLDYYGRNQSKDFAAAFMAWLFLSHVYAPDVQDLIFHFSERQRRLQDLYEKRETWEYDRYRI